MDKRKRCTRCNMLNEPERVYCMRCGKYLNGRQYDKASIWGSPVPEIPVEPEKKKFGEMYAVVCPQCGMRSQLRSKDLPLMCDECGYFFQPGIDRVETCNERAEKEPQRPARETSGFAAEPPKRYPAEEERPTRRNPLPSTRGDRSTMRVTVITSNQIPAQNMNPAGNIIGRDATVLMGVDTSEQIRVWHTLGGWYASSGVGAPMLNNCFMRPGHEVRLKDGDFLVVGKSQLRVEIFPDAE